MSAAATYHGRAAHRVIPAPVPAYEFPLNCKPRHHAFVRDAVRKPRRDTSELLKQVHHSQARRMEPEEVAAAEKQLCGRHSYFCSQLDREGKRWVCWLYGTTLTSYYSGGGSVGCSYSSGKRCQECIDRRGAHPEAL